MKSLASLFIAIPVAAVAVYLLVKLVFLALEAIVVLIGVAIALAIFFAAERAFKFMLHKA